MDLPCHIVDDPTPEHIFALRKRIKLSCQKFADRLGLGTRAVPDWEQGHRVTSYRSGGSRLGNVTFPPEIDTRLDLE